MSHHSGTYAGDWDGYELVHRIEDYSGGAECTLYPSTCAADALMTRWMTADEDSFVDLTEMR